MIHSVGCPQPKADAFMKNWNRADANAFVHAIVEPDGDVYQLLPWDFRGWHCGGSANNTHTGVEMTEPVAIIGKALAAADQMEAYLKKKNPAVPQSVLDMVPLYFSEGEAEGVRGDTAFAQSASKRGISLSLALRSLFRRTISAAWG